MPALLNLGSVSRYAIEAYESGDSWQRHRNYITRLRFWRLAQVRLSNAEGECAWSQVYKKCVWRRNITWGKTMEVKIWKRDWRCRFGICIVCSSESTSNDHCLGIWAFMEITVVLVVSIVDNVSIPSVSACLFCSVLIDKLLALLVISWMFVW